MQQIADWLEKLGLGQYAQRFAENDINFGILPHLTDQDLKELGVASLGHRRQLLLAIAELDGVQKDAVQPPAATEAPIVAHETAERRQVTVMFSDLVGSTALSARMDPEDLREVISAYQRCVAETVRRFGGFVAKYLGDGVLVYFGYPQAHEDDAERAVRAGLALVIAVNALKTRAPLQTRIGIATGLVVVGDLIGAGESQERGIVGETPNLAARLQVAAKPNAVVIAESTRKLLGNLFELEALDAKNLKGIVEPVRAWAALRPSSVESRFEALHAAGLTALVGREEELELLLRRWSRAKTGEGQVVLLSGEAGIGKSRLTTALLEHLADEPHTRLRYFCSPQHTDSAFYPIIGQMERAAGFTHDDALPTKLDKLDAVLAQTSTSTQDAALFAEMLSLTNDGRYPALDPDPQRRRQRTLEALNLQMEVLSRSNPVLMIVEDVHWSDPLLRGDIAEARAHFDRGIALYDPSQHRPLATRFGEDHRVVSLTWRSWALWLLGYPETARADVDQAFKDARASGHAVSLIRALNSASFIEIFCREYRTANARLDELIALTDEKDAVWWRTIGMLHRGRLLGLTGRAADAVQMITSGIAAWRSTGTTLYLPSWLSNLAGAHSELGQLDEAWRSIGEAMNMMETTKEKCFQAEANRIAGEIALKSPEPDTAKAQAYFERALAVARKQQAKSWELRAAMSMARLWRDQGKRDEARALLAPVYRWFTEGFDTLDLKEAKKLLDELNA